MRDTGGRHELKHYINPSDMAQLQGRLPYVMQRDENTDPQGGYRIRSLYFDNYNDKALKEKVDGVDEREKFRLRFYGKDTSFIRLEKKSKKSGLCYKHSAEISYQTSNEILAGHYEGLKSSGIPLHMELYAKLFYQNLRPKIIVDYRRNAFVFKAGNVRVTLDFDIRTSNRVSDFLLPEFTGIPIPPTYILEVKYDCFLPELIRGITTLSSRQQTAFSKYAVSRIF